MLEFTIPQVKLKEWESERSMSVILPSLKIFYSCYIRTYNNVIYIILWLYVVIIYNYIYYTTRNIGLNWKINVIHQWGKKYVGEKTKCKTLSSWSSLCHWDFVMHTAVLSNVKPTGQRAKPAIPVIHTSAPLQKFK